MRLKADPMPHGKPARKRKWDHEGRWGHGFPLSSPLYHFVAGPLAASLYFSFSDYDMLNPPEWSGLDNFRRMAEDSMFWRSLWNTLYFAVLFVPLQTFRARAGRRVKPAIERA